MFRWRDEKKSRKKIEVGYDIDDQLDGKKKKKEKAEEYEFDVHLEKGKSDWNGRRR